MGKYDEITEARKILGLNSEETLKEIKRKINALIKKWHPDISKIKGDDPTKKSITLLKAKKIIMDYCENYKISFSEQEINKYLSPEELWAKKFGKDHIWGDNTEK
jgi:curved DNA-binding protein CbpA